MSEAPALSSHSLSSALLEGTSLAQSRRTALPAIPPLPLAQGTAPVPVPTVVELAGEVAVIAPPAEPAMALPPSTYQVPTVLEGPAPAAALATPTRAAAVGREVRPATEADKPDILAMIAEMIPGVDAEARWRWLYERNPAGRALTWVATVNGQVAGCTSFFPIRMWLDGQPAMAALGGDGYVRPQFRRNGLGYAMHAASRDAMPANQLGCMYGAPDAMNVTPLKNGGSVEIGHAARWVRPIRAAALGVNVPLLRRLPVAMPTTSAVLQPIRVNDPRIDAVWAEARTALPLAAVRDSAFYTWRYLATPSRRQPAFIIMQRGHAIGACAFELTHHGKVMALIDLMTVPGAWHAGLEAVVRHATEQTRVDRIDMKLFAPDGRRRRMWRAGFAEREIKPFLCMVPEGGDRRFQDPARWFYTGADSDLDTLSM